VLRTLVLAPRSTVVLPDDGIDVERRYVPFNGTDAILLTTERTDHPGFAIGTPHHRLHRWTMREDARDS
jgi:putative aminopeptidase FrvX